MSRFRKLSHSIWHCQYHIVWVPKYRFRVLEGKVGAAFGSYGWSGEAPNILLEIMKNRFKMDVVEPALRVKYNPDEKSLEECRQLGKSVAEKMLKSSLN